MSRVQWIYLQQNKVISWYLRNTKGLFRSIQVITKLLELWQVSTVVHWPCAFSRLPYHPNLFPICSHQFSFIFSSVFSRLICANLGFVGVHLTFEPGAWPCGILRKLYAALAVHRFYRFYMSHVLHRLTALPILQIGKLLLFCSIFSAHKDHKEVHWGTASPCHDDALHLCARSIESPGKRMTRARRFRRSQLYCSLLHINSIQWSSTQYFRYICKVQQLQTLTLGQFQTLLGYRLCGLELQIRSECGSISTSAQRLPPTLLRLNRMATPYSLGKKIASRENLWKCDAETVNMKLLSIRVVLVVLVYVRYPIYQLRV